MSSANSISGSNQPAIDNTNVPEILKHVPSPKEDVALKAIRGFFKWAITSIAGISIGRSLVTKKLEFIQPNDLLWVIGGGIASGVLDGAIAMSNNKKFDTFVEQLEQEKLKAHSNTVKCTQGRM